MKYATYKAIQELISRYPDLQLCADPIAEAFHVVHSSFQNRGKLLLCGNGGSSADCDHIVGELMKGFLSKRPVPASVRDGLVRIDEAEGAVIADRLQGALPAISLTSQSALLTAFANDVDPEMTFAQQVYGYGQKGDVLMGLSTSGNSVNIIRALQVAKALDLTTVGLSGKKGGAMEKWCDVIIRVPYERTPDVQERHLPVYHTLCIMLEEAFFSS